MTQTNKNAIFDDLPLLVFASRSFRLRCLMDAKDDITREGAITDDTYKDALKEILHEEILKAKILRVIETIGEPFSLEKFLEITNHMSEISDPAKIALLYQLVVEGFILYKAESPESTTFTLKTTDHDEIIPYYLPVQAIEDGKACSGCSLCQAVCPVGCIQVNDGKVSIDMDICIRCGLCYTACPRSFLPKKVFEWQEAGHHYSKNELKLGSFIEAWSARTTDPKIESIKQDGGVVTSLITHAFNQGDINGAIGAGMVDDVPWKPLPILMRNQDDVYKSAGTKYVNTPSLQLLRDLPSHDKIAMVGTPCMMQALRKADYYTNGIISTDQIKYRIGIFCMESFTHAGIKHLAEKILETPLETIKKMDINAGKFFVYPEDGEPKAVSMKEITKLARMGCHCCFDLTSEQADISVGSIGSPSGWNTVLVRNERGKKLFDAAVAAGIIERKPIEEVKPGLGLLKKLSFRKKRSYEREEKKRNIEGKFHPAYMMILPPKPKKNKPVASTPTK